MFFDDVESIHVVSAMSGSTDTIPFTTGGVTSTAVSVDVDSLASAGDIAHGAPIFVRLHLSTVGIGPGPAR